MNDFTNDFFLLFAKASFMVLLTWWLLLSLEFLAILFNIVSMLKYSQCFFSMIIMNAANFRSQISRISISLIFQRVFQWKICSIKCYWFSFILIVEANSREKIHIKAMQTIIMKKHFHDLTATDFFCCFFFSSTEFSFFFSYFD